MSSMEAPASKKLSSYEKRPDSSSPNSTIMNLDGVQFSYRNFLLTQNGSTAHGSHFSAAATTPTTGGMTSWQQPSKNNNCDNSSLAANPSTARRKGGQIRFSYDQLLSLERRFQQQKYLEPHERTQLAKKLHLTERQIKTWFQNRRAKWRRVSPTATPTITRDHH